MIKLCEFLNTPYMLENMVYKWNELAKLGEDIDIAGARLTPAMAEAIQGTLANSSINIIDSENHERNKILQENYRRSKLNYIAKEPPAFPINGDWKSYFAKFNEVDIYDFSNPFTLKLNLAVVTLMQINMPTIKMDLGSYVSNLMRYVSLHLFRKNRQEIINSTDEYILLVDKSIRTINITEKDFTKKFYIYGIGETTWDEVFGNDIILIPGYFGNESIKKNKALMELWKPVADRAIADIREYARREWLTLKGFLEED